MKLVLYLLSITLISCATKLTKEAKSVQIVTDSQKEKFCKSIDIISASNSWGLGATQDQENAMNEIRNKAASLDGNGIRIISSNYISNQNNSEALIQAEVLKCDFNDKN